MIVADTGAVFALLDRSDAHHDRLRDLFADDPDRWVLPWAVLPEVDYLAATRLGEATARAWFTDVSSGGFAVEWGTGADLVQAEALARQYEALAIGLVDAIVMVVAERLRADIATLDVRHFGAVRLKHAPRLLPRDLDASKARPRRVSAASVQGSPRGDASAGVASERSERATRSSGHRSSRRVRNR